LKENAEKLSSEDKDRYENQYQRVTQIVALFEDPSYSDEDKEKTGRVVALMNEMQGFGTPPSEIMGAMPPGFELGSDGDPKLPDGCIIT